MTEKPREEDKQQAVGVLVAVPSVMRESPQALRFASECSEGGSHGSTSERRAHWGSGSRSWPVVREELESDPGCFTIDAACSLILVSLCGHNTWLDAAVAWC